MPAAVCVCVCVLVEEGGPYLSLGEVHQGLLSISLLGVEESAKLGASYHLVQQVAWVGAWARTGTQTLTAEWLHGLCKAQRSL